MTDDSDVRTELAAPRPRPKREQGTGGLYQRGLTWWIRYRHNGQQIRESSESTQRSVAVKLLKQRLGEIGSGRLIGPDAKRTTFEDLEAMLRDDYTLKARRSMPRLNTALNHLRAFFGGDRVPNITADRTTAYARSRITEGAAPATVRYELTYLKRAFVLAVRAGRAPHRLDVENISVDNAREGFFERADFAAVEAQLPRDLRPLMKFLFLTGWRVGEAMALTWSAVNLAEGIIRLEARETKTKQGRTFPFSTYPQLAELLTAQRERTAEVERREQRIVANVFHRNGKPIRRYAGAWKSACARAGLAGRLVHDLRRSAVRNLEQAGVPRSDAMRLTGHVTESVYKRYAISDERSKTAGVAKLAEFHAKPAAPAQTVSLSTIRAQKAV